MNALRETTAWERLWPLLVTAGLSLLVLAVVQLVVIPRLETRKRREQRWETDLLALGEFLTFDYREALDGYTHALRFGAMLAEIGTGAMEPEHERKGWTDYHQMRREAVDPYARACSRLDWLADRVAALDRLHPRLWRLWAGCVQANSALNDIDPRYRIDQDTLATPDAVDVATRNARERIEAVVTQIKCLANGKPPVQPSRLRRQVRDWWRTRMKMRAEHDPHADGSRPVASP